MSHPFPRLEMDTHSVRDCRSSWISTTRSSAFEVHDIVYGNAEASDSMLERLYEPNARYENPLITATSRSIIADIHFLTRQLSELDVPKPLAMFATLFGKHFISADPWFQALRVWSELGEICESESFDDNRTSIVEHTLHMLLLPGIHNSNAATGTPSSTGTLSSPSLDVVSTNPLTNGLLLHSPPAGPSLTILPGVAVASPFHFKLRIITRLSFNEQGRITYHRDSWDVRDLVALVPGMGTAQAVSTRIAGYALSAAASLGAWALGGKRHAGGGSGVRLVRASLLGPEEGNYNYLGLAGVQDRERQTEGTRS